MKILQVNKFFFAEYGTEKYMFALCDLLQKKGHTIIHFSTKDPRNRYSRQNKFFVNKSDLSRARINFSALRDLWRMIYNREAAGKFKKLLDRENPDLIHVHSIHHQISPAILKVANDKGIPIVQTLHDYKLLTPGYFFPWRDGHICYRCQNGHWLHLLRHKAHKNSRLATLAVIIESFWHRHTKAYTKYVDHFIVPSKDMRERFIRHGFNEKKISVLPHFLPTKYAQKTSSETYRGKAHSDTPVGRGILFAGRLAPERGLDHVLYFAKNLPGQDFLVAGDGPERARLENQIKKMALNNVHLMGRLPEKELWQAYHRARLVIFPTKTAETFGLTVLEAQAAGKPVVATGLGGIGDLIKDEVNGFLYPVGDPAMGLKIIRRLTLSDQLTAKIGLAAKKNATKYKAPAHLAALQKIYDQVIRTNSKSIPGYKIALLGHRGIPGNYGGFETFAEELATRLAKKNHQVVVYCRADNKIKKPGYYKDVKLVHLKTIRNKYLDTLAHTFKSVWHAIFIEKPDAIIMVNVGNAILSVIPRLFGIPVILNVDGLEWERKKWARPAKLYLRVSAYLAKFLPTVVVTDAKVIFDYYRDRLNLKTQMIPYGATVTRSAHPQTLAKYGLKKDEYFLYVARFEPENNAHLVVKAFEQANTRKKLVMVGDAPYATRYCRQVRATKDPRIIFLGFVYGKDYKALQQNAYAYIQATEVGGTHPALIEAMGFGNCVLVNGTPENMETANGSAIPFWFFKGKNTTSGLTKKINMIENDFKTVKRYRQLAQNHITKNYRWQTVTDQYLSLIYKLVNSRRQMRVGVVKSQHV